MIRHWSCTHSSWASSPSPSLLEIPHQQEIWYLYVLLPRIHPSWSYCLVSLLFVTVKDFERLVSLDCCHFLTSQSLVNSSAIWFLPPNPLKELFSYLPVTLLLPNLAINMFMSSFHSRFLTALHPKINSLSSLGFVFGHLALFTFHTSPGPSLYIFLFWQFLLCPVI